MITPSRLIQWIELDLIRLTSRNPRSDPDTEINELASSMRSQEDARLVQNPLVRPTGDGMFTVVDGERRVRAARLAGWVGIWAEVREILDALEEHNLRLLGNSHRSPMHALDRAASLMITYLVTNADEVGWGQEARELLRLEQSSSDLIAALRIGLEERGWAATAPARSWQSVLDGLGIELEPSRRKQLIRLLNLDPTLAARARSAALPEPALRAVASLAVEQQVKLFDALVEDPQIRGAARRIARTVRDGIYPTVAAAVAEARGEVPGAADFYEERGAAVDAAQADDPSWVKDPWAAARAASAEESSVGVPSTEASANMVMVLAQDLGPALAGCPIPQGLQPPWVGFVRMVLLDLTDQVQGWLQGAAEGDGEDGV